MQIYYRILSEIKFDSEASLLNPEYPFSLTFNMSYMITNVNFLHGGLNLTRNLFLFQYSLMFIKIKSKSPNFLHN